MQDLEVRLRRLMHIHPRVVDLSLERMQALLMRLGNPQDHLPPVVHIAGTNGKGSTLAILCSISESLGRRVHVYTSPHLIDFCERIRVAGHPVSESALIKALDEVEAACLGHQSATFFEVTTAAAFLLFSRVCADLVLLETGLGGRLDATNVVSSPVATILTPISMDHEDYLGSSLEAIAREKVGILRPGVPCISAAQDTAVVSMIEQECQRLGAPLLVQGRDYDVVPTGRGDILYTSVHGASYRLPHVSLQGRHQIQNAAVALAAAEVTHGVYPEAWALGLEHAQWPARLQHLRAEYYSKILLSGWELWLDGGHNPAAGLALAQHIQDVWHDTPVDVVVGMLANKDADRFLEHLVNRVRRIRTVPVSASEAGCDPRELAMKAQGLGANNVQACASVEAALYDLVTEIADRGPRRVLVCGSLYLAGTVLAHQKERQVNV